MLGAMQNISSHTKLPEAQHQYLVTSYKGPAKIDTELAFCRKGPALKTTVVW